MTPTECMRMLELGHSASVEDIQRAWRRLARRWHPDHCGDDEVSRSRFIEICRAYRTLIRAARASREGRPVGTCWQCGEFGEVLSAPDGQPRCSTCIFRPGGGRLLPPPALIVVKCSITLAMLLLSAGLLYTAGVTERPLPAMLGMVACVAGMAALAWTCLSVVHCETRHDRKMRDQMRRMGH